MYSSHLAPDISTTDPEFQAALFDFLRNLHPKQARKLAKAKWKAPDEDLDLYLLPNDELREAYSDVIGQVAESHWLYPHELEKYHKTVINPPAILHPAPWPIDIFKLCIILRVADAAHINSQRAPKFLFALTEPKGISLIHWQFQSKIHGVARDSDPERKELKITGSSFSPERQEAWWMAYDIAKLIDKELRAADRLLLDFNRKRLEARSVANINTPDDFSRSLPTEGWQPVDTSIKITDIKSIVDRFGGEKLYGNSPIAALRELIQNSADAIRACRSLEGLGSDEGEIEVALHKDGEGKWLTVTDTGVGMSRYVLTDVLLDFGKSLWGSSDLKSEWSSLSSTNFKSIGQFGIGFFSIFMLGDKVKITTRRLENKLDESASWVLEFSAGTSRRPTLRSPTVVEKLKRHGTKISVLLSDSASESLLPKLPYPNQNQRFTLTQTCSKIALALDINLFTRLGDEERQLAVKASDWVQLSTDDILSRTQAFVRNKSDVVELSEIKEGSRVKARLSIYNAPGLKSFVHSIGCGATNGIYTGDLPGVYGIVESTCQTDLARKTTIPNITAEEFITWAEDQKEKLITSNKVNLISSALLIRIGANHSNLLVGLYKGKEITVEDLCVELSGINEIIVHSGEISYEEDDNIGKYEFMQYLEKEENVLEICDVQTPDWMTRIENFKPNHMMPLVSAIIDDVWKGGVSESDVTVVVGEAGGAEIQRHCTVYKRED